MAGDGAAFAAADADATATGPDADGILERGLAEPS
jgi:hypothetical protein